MHLEPLAPSPAKPIDYLSVSAYLNATQLQLEGHYEFILL
jgi:hypothetical protein